MFDFNANFIITRNDGYFFRAYILPQCNPVAQVGGSRFNVFGQIAECIVAGWHLNRERFGAYCLFVRKI